MNLSFIIFLLLFLPLLIFSLWISKERVLKDLNYKQYAVGILVVLILWDGLGQLLRHWYYPTETNINFYILQSPLEAVVSAFVFPLFIISFWEFIKRR